MESPAGEGAAPLPAADTAAPPDTPDTTTAAGSAAAPDRQPDDDPHALPPAWRDPAAPADAPADPLPFIGATPATHRGLLVHAPAVVGLVLALLRDEPALATALFDATWSPDDPLRTQLHDRTARLTRWADATLLASDAPESVTEDHEWRDRIVELSDLLLPMLPLLFTPELVEAELQMDADLSTAGALRKLTAFARTAPQPAPILAPMVIAALIGIRPAADLADQLAIPGADERQLLRRLQERYDGWEAPTWAAIIRVTAAAWREASPWRRLLLHAQLDRLRFVGMAPPEPLDEAAAAPVPEPADPRLAAELDEAKRALARAGVDLNAARADAAEAQALRRQLEEGRIKQQRTAERRDLLEQRLTAAEEELRQLRQSLAAAEHERDHWRRTATGEPEADDADDDPAPAPAPVPDAPPVPADLLAGYRVALFTGHENAGVRAKMLDTLRGIGAGDDAQVHLIRGATRGRAQYGEGDLVLVDCRFVSHKETELLETRVGPDALLLNLHRGTGGLQAELGARLHRDANGTLSLKR